MSIKIMTVVWDVELPDSEKLILLALADWANDDGVCWPSIRRLCKKCSKSERTVQRAIGALADKGHLTKEDRPGHGVLYHLHPRQDDPRQDDAPSPSPATPVTMAPNTLLKPQISPQTPQPVRDETGGSDAGDQFWRIPSGKSWADAGPMLRRLEGKPERRTRRRQQAPVATPSPLPTKPKRPVTAKARETERSAIMHAALRRELGNSVYEQWFEQAAMIHDDPGATVIVNNQFQQTWIEDRFRPKLLSAARHAFGEGVSWVRVQAEHHG